MSAHGLLVLDGLFDDLDVETAVAASHGWSVWRWDGSEPPLREAVEVFKRANRSMRVAEASVDVLGAAADAWRTPGAPEERAGARDFARFLANQLPTHMRNHAAR